MNEKIRTIDYDIKVAQSRKTALESCLNTKLME